jgi:hypothetical protein
VLSWKKVTAGVYHATSPWGLYTIDGSGYGRNRWTVTYPGGDYGMVDALAEAKAWAQQDADDRAQRKPSHAAKKKKLTSPPKRREELFVRFGTWHPSERSRNYARGGSEDGVSVYDVMWRPKDGRWDVRMPSESDNPWGPEDTFWTLIKKAEAGEDPIFVVRGDVVGVGHDGEPLIQHIAVVKPVTVQDLMSSDLRWRGLDRSASA